MRQLLTAGADANRGGQATPLASATSRFVHAANLHSPQSTEVIALLLDADADPHARGGEGLSKLRARTVENVQFCWWSGNDPNVLRLMASMYMPHDWTVV